jgi:hypothetical protein
MRRRSSLPEIFKAQIEEHRTEVFYNRDATGWGAEFVKGLSGCVKYKMVWHAVSHTDLTFYDNFSSILADMQRRGCKVQYLFPAYDPELSRFPVATSCSVRLADIDDPDVREAYRRHAQAETGNFVFQSPASRYSR